jgi:hypothetical protein
MASGFLDRKGGTRPSGAGRFGAERWREDAVFIAKRLSSFGRMKASAMLRRRLITYAA